MYLGAMGRFGDVISDGMTWVTYGNEILSRGGSVEEAGRAVANIDVFVTNRGAELDAVSPGSLNQILDMKMKLAAYAQGKWKPESTTGVFFDELGANLKEEMVDGAKGVIDAPGKAYNWAKTELEKAFDKGKDAAKDLALPVMVIAGGAVAIAYIIYSKK